jgi:hypothetical protein
MPQKIAHRQINSGSAAPVVLFGLDESGKPKAARFSEKQADLAIKAATHLKLQVLPVVGPEAIDLAGRLVAGRIHANGRGFVPYIRRDLYAKLVAASGTSSHGNTTSASAKVAAETADGKPPAAPPKSWNEIGPGHVVIAQQSPEDGWFEAIVVESSGDTLTLRWRDYPRERRLIRNRLAVGLMYPNYEGRVTPTNSNKPTKTVSLSEGTPYPKSWDDIAIGCVVLAKDDGPWCSWWEATPAEQTGDTFSLQWRNSADMPKVARPNVTRHRLTLGLLFPNGQ